MKYLEKFLYFLLGAIFSFDIAYLSRRSTETEKESIFASFNYESGCSLVSKKISDKYNLDNSEWQKFCMLKGIEIKNNYISISNKIDLIDP